MLAWGLWIRQFLAEPHESHPLRSSDSILWSLRESVRWGKGAHQINADSHLASCLEREFNTRTVAAAIISGPFSALVEAT